MDFFNANKKLLISAGAFCVLIALLVAVLLILGDKGEIEPESETTTLYQQSEFTSEEILTSEKPTNSAVMNSGLVISENEQNIMSAFINGVYYLKGATVEGGGSAPIELAIDGTNIHTTTEMDNMELGIMFLNNNIYIVNEKDKKYLNMKDLTALTGSSLDFDTADIQELVKTMNMSQFNFTEIEKSDVNYDGQDATLYTCISADINLNFYFTNENLRKIELVGQDGTTSMELDIDIFYPYVPSDMLTLSGLTRTTIITFFGEEFFNQ